jgi:DNA-binding NtrC family response regulator
MGEVVLLLGLEESLNRDLRGAMRAEDRTVHSSPFLPPADILALIDRLHPAVVFLGGNWRSARQILRSADAPVVVVSRQPEVSDWLDAIEAGATDYCAPPFEPTHLRWILESVGKARAVAA